MRRIAAKSGFEPRPADGGAVRVAFHVPREDAGGVPPDRSDEPNGVQTRDRQNGAITDRTPPEYGSQPWMSSPVETRDRRFLGIRPHALVVLAEQVSERSLDALGMGDALEDEIFGARPGGEDLYITVREQSFDDRL